MKRVITTDHSPHTGYDKWGCRCEACVTVHNLRVKRNREQRLKSGNLTHGTRSAFDAGCRCDDCARARQEAATRLKESERAAERYRQRKGGA